MVHFLLLVLAVTAVAADELSEGPSQLTCPPDQGSDSSYWFTLPVPSEYCKNSTIECFYYLGVRRNPFNDSYADFQLVATAQGYVAVGFSKDRLMGEDDVIGCKRDPQTGRISVVSAWNPTPRHAPNERDPSESGVCLYHASYTDGQLSCRFSRYIAAVNPGFDYDLNNSYILFLARSDNGSSPHFLKHKDTPLVSYFPINVLHDNTTNAGYIPRGGLVKAHGVLMLLAWILIYAVLVLFVSSRKRDFIDLSRKNWWFQTIRALSITAVVVMVIGIFLVNKNNSPPSLISSTCGLAISHAVMGYITPLTVVAYLLLFHFIFPPACTQTRSLCIITAVMMGLCVAFAVLLVIIDVLLGLVLFQTGCVPVDPLNDNLPVLCLLQYCRLK